MWPFKTKSDNQARLSLEIEGLHCVSCGLNIDSALEDIPGVIKSQTDFARGKTEVEIDQDQVEVSELKKAIQALGYKTKTSR